MKITETRTFNFVLAFIALIMNICFYTLLYPETGAKYAWDVHPLFWGMCQGLFLYAIIAYTYFGIKKL